MRHLPLARKALWPARRRVAAALGALAFGAALPRAGAQRALVPTPSQTEGPFYPRSLPADRDADLTRVAGRSGRARGVPLYLSGRVLSHDGDPLAGAAIELWQCDATGRYHHVGDPGPLDDDFQGYGATTADAQGRFAFVTIRPVAYPGRPPHLHFKLKHPSTPELTTQLYVAGDDARGDSVLSFSPRGTRERLSIALANAPEREPGALAATYDFVLASR
jgi:protocatechuate 3,4-dioxygenase beta subunit